MFIPSSDEVFSTYKHREILPGCRPHPGEIVEPGSLSVSTTIVWSNSIGYVKIEWRSNRCLKDIEWS